MKRIQIYPIDVTQLFEPIEGGYIGKTESYTFEYGDSIKKQGKGGRGGAESPAFQVRDLSVSFNTAGGETFEDLTEDIQNLTGSVIPPKIISPTQFDQ